jgi:D-arabinose 1-dehydrogenase-like Zn-dependent alcohol dehydrogenase
MRMKVAQVSKPGRANEAFERMIGGKAQFRVVLTMES